MALELENRLADAWPPEQWHDLTVLVAVSGGSDSVALLRAMAVLKTDGSGRLMAAHFNHATRGNESDEDEAFVVRLCRRLDVPCLVGRAAEDAASNSGGEGIEAALREARYEFLRHWAAQAGARYLVTGHTADDQAETILHRILRGTGIGGLAGMARSRPLGEATTLVRPLLEFRRAELIEYLDTLGQPYRVDSSNANSQFTRNRLRHELLPLLAEQYNPAIGEALLRLGSLAAEVQTVVDHLVRDLADRAVVEHGSRIAVSPAAVADEPRYLVRELLIAAWRGRGWPEQSMGRAEWDQLAEMLLSGRPRKKMFPGEVTARRDDDRLWLERK